MYEGLTGWRKVVLSWPFMVLIYGVPFGLLQEYVVSQSSKHSLYGVAVIGLPFGALMTVVSRESNKRRMKKDGVKNVKQRQQFFKYVNKVQLPEDSKHRKVFEAYVDRQLKLNKNNRLWSTTLFLVIGMANFIPALLDKRNRLFGIVLSIFLFAMAIMSYYYSNKQLIKLKDLKNKL
jgi:hypothetical protein